MAAFTAVTLEEVRALALGFEVPAVETLTPVPHGSVNSNFRLRVAGGGSFFLRVYEEQAHAGARAEAALLRHLAARGVPTPAPLVARSGDAITTLCGKPAAISPWREGHMRCQASVTANDTAAVGAALAAVHVAGAGAEVGAGRFNAQDLRVRLARIAASPDPELRAQAAPLTRALDTCEGARATHVPRGLIHGDLFRDNVLWSAGEIAALLDFESASRGVVVFDLAVTLLAWCYGSGFDPALARAMFDGYERVRPLSNDERVALREEARFAALRFTITRITDFAMRAGGEGRVSKDWHRFAARFASVDALVAALGA